MRSLLPHMVNTGNHWLAPFRKPLFKSYALHSERTGCEMLFGVGVKNTPAICLCVHVRRSKLNSSACDT